MKHTKPFGIYHWDTFDNETILIDEADTLEEAENKIHTRYGPRIGVNGADKVDVVDDKGTVVRQFNVC